MIYKGQKTTPEFHFIKPIMEAWTSLYEKTAEAYPQDDKYYIQELGGVALLCTASWMGGTPAVTEWPIKKQGSKWGHADILLGTGDMKIAGEAKIAWIYNRGSFNGVVKKLKKAQKAASKLPSDLANYRLGILFALFWVKELDEDLVEETIKRFEVKPPIVGVAWSLTAPKPQQVKKYSPGGFVVFSKPC